jgi:phosphoribosylaminoimidazolecarboxamide formyltransferase/IMP cyclohydrolase
MKELKDNNIQPIDMVVVNLYPFVQTVSKEGVTLDTALENIDIGGPTMIRASAKNFPGVIVIVDPADYPLILEKLRNGEVDMAERQRWRKKPSSMSRLRYRHLPYLRQVLTLSPRI